MAKTTEKASKTKANANTNVTAKVSTAAAKSGARGGAKGRTGTPVVRPAQPGVERRKNHPMRAKHGYFHVILTHTVPHLGTTGDLVRVKPGFARNYLIPQGLATFATSHNVRQIEQHRERLRQREEARRADLRSLAAKIGQRKVLIQANANTEGILYGSVNAEQIAAALRVENFAVDAEHVRLQGALKELGQYTVKLNLGSDVEAEIELWVVPSHTEDAAN